MSVERLAGWPRRPVRIALCAGMLVRHDAISYSLRLKLDVLRQLRNEGYPLHVAAFVHVTDDPADDVVSCRSVSDMVRDPRFFQADVHLFEFGMYYELFDAVFLLDDPSHVAAAYHNITPLELVTDESVRPAIERSFVQKHNLVRVGEIACKSEFNFDDLVNFGIPRAHLSVLHLPPARDAVPRATPNPGDPVELLYLGRMVRAKGVLDLLEVTRRLADAGAHHIRVTLVGPATFSEPEVLSALPAEHAADASVRYLGNLDDSQVAQLMSHTDVVVIPSYHEGYCLPVIEAYQAGCQVIAYDAGNLPNVVGGLGQLVPTGDLDALEKSVARAVDLTEAGRRSSSGGRVPTQLGDMDAGDWRDSVARHLQRFSRRVYDEQVLALIGRTLSGVTRSDRTLEAAR